MHPLVDEVGEHRADVGDLVNRDGQVVDDEGEDAVEVLRRDVAHDVGAGRAAGEVRVAFEARGRARAADELDEL